MDITPDQWDRTACEFRDEENGAIGFLCQDFSAVIRDVSDE
jgi:hypothetical protein